MILPYVSGLAGDEIDAAYQEEIQEVVDMTGTPETAFKIFNDVVRNVFEWDEERGTGGCGLINLFNWVWYTCTFVTLFVMHTYFHIIANINLGRIAALLAYCYRLCRTYVNTYLGSSGLLTFMGMIAGWLFRVFLRARFYEWLDKQGGWVSKNKNLYSRVCTVISCVVSRSLVKLNTYM